MAGFRNRFFGGLTLIAMLCTIGGTIHHACFFPCTVKGAVKEAIKEENMEAFHKISVTSDTGSLVISEGSSYSFTVPEDFTDEVTYEVKDDTLKVVTKNPTPHLSVINKGVMTITVPSDTSLSGLDVDLAMGGLDLASLSVDKTKLVLAMGAITAGGCSLGETELNAAMGGITLDDCQGSTLDVEAAMGSIKLNKVDYDKIDAEADMGSITIQHKTSPADLTLDLQTAMGRVTVDGEKCGSSYNQKGSSGKEIEAKSSMGSIEIE